MSLSRKVKIILSSTKTWIPCKPPKWVKDAAERILYNPRTVRPYDKTKIFYGNTFVYKVWFETIAQGQIKPRYYKRKKIQKQK